MRFLILVSLLISPPAFAQVAAPRQPTAEEVRAEYNFQLGQTLANLGRVQAQNIQLQKQVDELKAQLAAKEDNAKKDRAAPSP